MKIGDKVTYTYTEPSWPYETLIMKGQIVNKFFEAGRDYFWVVFELRSFVAPINLFILKFTYIRGCGVNFLLKERKI